MSPRKPPVVLVFSGHDPTAGAGVIADALALQAVGCHAAAVVTAVTVQDTSTAYRFQPVEVELIRDQAGALIADMPIAACKTGMLATPEAVATVVEVIAQLGDVPVVVDPVLAAGSGASLARGQLASALVNWLIPRATVITPNIAECLVLAEERTMDAKGAATRLLQGGCKHVLLTGTHADTPDVEHWLFGPEPGPRAYRCPRLPHDYHGSGCTLAAALAGYLAQGLTVPDAVDRAVSYTWRSLDGGYRIGRGQHIPDRRIRHDD